MKFNQNESTEQFEEWANEKGFCLDQVFLESPDKRRNPYLNEDTNLAFEIWTQSRTSLIEKLNAAIDKCPKCGESIESNHDTPCPHCNSLAHSRAEPV